MQTASIRPGDKIKAIQTFQLKDLLKIICFRKTERHVSTGFFPGDSTWLWLVVKLVQDLAILTP